MREPRVQPKVRVMGLRHLASGKHTNLPKQTALLIARRRRCPGQRDVEMARASTQLEAAATSPRRSHGNAQDRASPLTRRVVRSKKVGHLAVQAKHTAVDRAAKEITFAQAQRVFSTRSTEPNQLSVAGKRDPTQTARTAALLRMRSSLLVLEAMKKEFAVTTQDAGAHLASCQPRSNTTQQRIRFSP